MRTSKNVKVDTITQAAPWHGWAPKDSFQRAMSELDDSTGRLTGDQQQVYADLPVEEWSNQPSTSSKLVMGSDGGCTYHRLQPTANGWAHLQVYGL